jgi:PKD repeat protein
MHQSDTVKHHIWIDNTTPPAPGILSFTQNNLNISIDWTTSQEEVTDSTSGIDKYFYTFTKNYPLSRGIIVDDTWQSTTNTIIENYNIEKEGVWNFFVAAGDNAHNYSDISTEMFSIDLGPPDTPIWEETVMGDKGFTLNWGENTNGDVISFYLYQTNYSNTGEDSWEFLIDLPYQITEYYFDEISGPQSYRFKLKAKDVFGNWSEDSQIQNVMYIPPSPDANFMYEHTGNLFEVAFTDLSDTAAIQLEFWKWDFGDGITSSNQNPVHEYPGNGIYVVSLEAIDAWGMSNVYIDTLKILPQLGIDPINSMNFDNSYTGHESRKEISLINDGIGILEYGYTISDKSSTNYIINCSDENPLSRINDIQISLPDLIVDKNDTVVVVPVYLSNIVDLNSISFHIEDTPDILECISSDTPLSDISVNVSDNEGVCNVELSGLIDSGSEDNMKIANISFSILFPLVSDGVELSITNMTALDGNDNVLSNLTQSPGSISLKTPYSLNPQESTSLEICYTPTASSEIIDSLILYFSTNELTNSDSIEYIVWGSGLATEAPEASFNVTPTVGIVNETAFKFESTSKLGTGDSITYTWDFRDNSTSSENSPSHVYDSTDTFYPYLWVESTHGGDNSESTEINVYTSDKFTFALTNPDNNSILSINTGGINFKWDTPEIFFSENVIYTIYLGKKNDNNSIDVEKTYTTYNNWQLINDNSYFNIGENYAWMVSAKYDGGSDTSKCKNTFYFTIDNTSSIINNTHPQYFNISKIHPNPFNPVTNIQFALPKAAQVKLTIFDLTGREVITLADNFYSPGYHSMQWQGSDHPSGLYLVHLTALSGTGEVQFQQTEKLMLLK